MLIPQFLPGPSGHLYTNLYLPEGNPQPSCWVLHFPAFAEEMNKSRHMVRKQAEHLASQGVAVLVPDLFGTGDSEGDFGEADWSKWKHDIEYLISWAQQQGAKEVVFWGLRLGCLLAVDVVISNPEVTTRLIFWQPVINGQQAMTQFLRLRMAAGLMGGKGENVGMLRNYLEDGRTLEVAGYDLAPALYRQVSDCATLTDVVIPPGVIVDWYEVVQSEGKPLNMMAQKVIGHWAEAGTVVNASTIVGDPFWTTQELANAPLLIEETSGLISREATTSDITQIVNESSRYQEHPLAFSCDNGELLGLLNPGEATNKRAVLVVVGGPQYRVGSHRQFLLLSRELADHGFAVFRFDYRGMGDSNGEYEGFDGVQNDIRCAIDALIAALPHIQEIVNWGLCDAATAASFYAATDPRVKGLILLNPWVRSESGEAKAYLKHYYLQRLLSKGFWQKVIRGEFKFLNSLKSLNETVKDAAATMSETSQCNIQESLPGPNLCARMEQGLSTFSGYTLFILSENDLTAAEFKDALNGSKSFKKLLKQARFHWIDVADADHTFSRRVWRDQVANLSVKWLKEW